MANKTKEKNQKPEINVLPDPPAEIKLDLETETETETTNEKETKMETTYTKPTRAALVSLATEMNNIIADCKINTAKSYNAEAITAQILSHEIELTSADFVPADENSIVFSHEAMETFINLGVKIPQPKTEKKAKEKKEKSERYTKQNALIDAIKTTTGARDEIVLEANRLLREKNPASDSTTAAYTGGRARCDKDIMTKLFRETTPILLAFGSLVLDETTKIYSLPVIES